MDEFIEAKKDIDGESAFRLYDTFGFPLELTKEIAEENGLKVDEEGYKVAMQEQKDRAKAATAKISVTGDIKYANLEREIGSTEFVGYTDNECEAKILGVIEGDGFVDVALNKTPFYAECGGQVGDSGIIEDLNGGQEIKLEVLTTFKVNDLYVHRCKVINGEDLTGKTVVAKIDVQRREEIRVHHTSAHLLQAALVKVLGDEVKQAGSYVDESRMRFDFTFSRAMTSDEIKKVEDLMNNWVGEGYKVETQVMGIKEAELTGATALFGEKYGDTVRVVSIVKDGECISKEFCAGTHARELKDLRLVKIVSESAIAAGTRRIELFVSKPALEYLNSKSAEIDKLSSKFKSHYDEVVDRVDKLADENRELQTKIEKLEEENARNKFSTFVSKAQDISGGKLFITKVAVGANAIKVGLEFLSNKLGDSVIVLAGETTVAVKVSDNFVKQGINAGQIVGEIARATGANGGGRPNFAQGGVKDASKLDEVLAKVEDDIKNIAVVK
jgi:alanyl-tRNA synthetase